jgi:hypothetical protein
MLAHSLLVAHIAVLGYWLGADLVINSTYRYVAWRAGMPFAERDRLMDHVMDVDQHVRYALLLQLGLGGALAGLLGYAPGGGRFAFAALLAAGLWLVLVEAVHRTRHTPLGARLAALDRALRYLAIAGLAGLAGAALAGRLALPSWLAWKLALLAGAIACGLGIRYALVAFFRTWDATPAQPGPAQEERIRRGYARATAVLVLLWVCLAGIATLSVLKPG